MRRRPTPPLPRAQRPRFQAAKLPFWLRVVVLVFGWLLILLGIVGLFLPVLQGGLFLALGFAFLSIASQTVHLWLRGIMGRWPRVWRRMEKFRRYLREKLHRGARPSA